jgi:hypothetical protein
MRAENFLEVFAAALDDLAAEAILCKRNLASWH